LYLNYFRNSKHHYSRDEIFVSMSKITEFQRSFEKDTMKFNRCPLLSEYARNFVKWGNLDGREKLEYY
jgi:hypothetical protein